METHSSLEKSSLKTEYDVFGRLGNNFMGMTTVAAMSQAFAVADPIGLLIYIRYLLNGGRLSAMRLSKVFCACFGLTVSRASNISHPSLTISSIVTG